jgi:hypothetical protein
MQIVGMDWGLLRLRFDQESNGPSSASMASDLLGGPNQPMGELHDRISPTDQQVRQLRHVGRDASRPA